MSQRFLLLQVRGQGLLCSGFTVHSSLGGCPEPGALAGFVPVKDRVEREHLLCHCRTQALPTLA